MYHLNILFEISLIFSGTSIHYMYVCQTFQFSYKFGSIRIALLMVVI